MSDGLSVQITGLEELRKTLNSVSEDTQRRGGRFALRKAAQVIQAKAKQNAERFDDPETGRKISDNIAIRWSGKHFRQTGDLMFRIGVLQGGIKSAAKGNPDTGAGGATPHWALVELGAEHMAAQPYLRPAAENSVGEVTDEFIKQYNAAIERAIKRAAKKGTTA